MEAMLIEISHRIPRCFGSQHEKIETLLKSMFIPATVVKIDKKI